MQETVYTYDAIVVGTGAAGYQTACSIAREGAKSVAIVTESVTNGTSRNTGSDKQTYYKLSLCGEAPDSVRRMAADLFHGGAVDGDNALCEAALSARCFMHLCELGIPFPCNHYGEYVGYKTDHDATCRATSAGPLTSKFMTEGLEREAESLNIPVYNGMYAVRVLKAGDEVCGLVCLSVASGDFVCFRAPHVIIATGGPAGIYAQSVYPEGHFGSTSLALRAGACLQNATEWQYGLASTHPRWNVSGTYMQVLPRFVSVDADGEEHEFLAEYFADPYEALSTVFLKGYQWPFDSGKVLGGSSVIDLLVFRENVLRGRRVYLDYTKNPFSLSRIDETRLSEECRTYLSRAGARGGVPIDRLEIMNHPAIELYRSRGVDLSKEYLEIALCAQHHNGGIAVNCWWQTRVEGLFAVGECAGTHGVARPGGCALNAGQVGATRAAQWVSVSKRRPIAQETFDEVATPVLTEQKKACGHWLRRADSASRLTRTVTERMTRVGGAIRDTAGMETALSKVRMLMEGRGQRIGVADRQHLIEAYRLEDILLVQNAVLSAMIDYAATVGKSRGGALYTNSEGQLRAGMEEMFRLIPDDGTTVGRVQEVSSDGTQCHVTWRDVRPIPEAEDFFETVWRGYRENRNIE